MNDGKIRIRMSPSADTRTADNMVSKDELRQSSEMHILDVQRAMKWLENKMEEAAKRHDWTKIEYLNQFYKQFHNAQETGEWGNGWYDKIHIVKERHHLNDNCPDNVSLIDVLEMLCDCVMAGLARTGEYHPEEPDPEILVRAYRNTAKMLVENTEIVEEMTF